VGEVKDIAGVYDAMPIAHLARAFRVARETVAKKLREAGVRPSGKRGGYDVYRLMDAAPAILDVGAGPDGENRIPDPSKMSPTDQRAWWQAKNEHLKFLQAEGQLVPKGEVHAQFAMIAKINQRNWLTLADVTERDTRCDPKVIEYLRKRARLSLDETAEAIASVDGEVEAEDDGTGISA